MVCRGGLDQPLLDVADLDWLVARRGDRRAIDPLLLRTSTDRVSRGCSSPANESRTSCGPKVFSAPEMGVPSPAESSSMGRTLPGIRAGALGYC